MPNAYSDMSQNKSLLEIQARGNRSRDGGNNGNSEKRSDAALSDRNGSSKGRGKWREKSGKDEQPSNNDNSILMVENEDGKMGQGVMGRRVLRRFVIPHIYCTIFT